MTNHIGDTNKMVSDTPRTEAEVNRSHGPLDGIVTIDADFAAQLERELNASTSEIERLTSKVSQLYEGAEEQKQRIKRLEDALKETVSWIVDLANSGDAGFLDADIMPEVIQARAALKAKEAKP
jgi:peptidoglycan hydrolase CwlO-like protein